MIQANPFQREISELGARYLAAMDRVLRSGWYILGSEVSNFESEFSRYLGAAHGVGCASGLDAILLALRAVGVGPGDEVITTPLTAMATALAISHLGARPVFVDVDEATLALDPALVKKAITSKTKAVIPVHLYGYPAPVEELVAICAEHHLCLIEDCAQAAGTITNSGKHAGTVGQIGCFSFYPTKNLGAFGDAGYACTSDTVLHQKLLKLRNYGQRARYDHEMTGYNSRLDELHAAVLREKLRELDRWNARRSKIASIYDARAKSTWTLPAALGAAKNAYHLYPIQVEDRDAMVATLKAHGIESLIHYPMLLPEQDAYAAYGYQKAEAAWPVAYNASRRLLSLPINPYVTDDEAEMVARMAFGG